MDNLNVNQEVPVRSIGEIDRRVATALRSARRARPQRRAELLGAPFGVRYPAAVSDHAVDHRIQQLQWLHLLAVGVCIALIAVAAWITKDSDADSVPVWLGYAAVGIAAIVSGFTVRYYLRRPLEREGSGDYTVTVAFRVGLALIPSLVAFVFTLLAASVPIQLVGAVTSGLLLAWTFPSEADYRHHRALAQEIGPIPPDEKWGEAEEDEIAPWENEHGH